MHPYHKPIDVGHELPTRIYGGMLAVWELRPNLQKKFPLHKNRRIDYLRFLAWCAVVGRRECRLLTEIEDWNEELQKPVQMPPLQQDKWAGAYTVGMYLVGLHRGNYWDAQIQANPKLRNRTARWYFREGRNLLGLNQSSCGQVASLKRNFLTFDDFINYIKLPDDGPETLEYIRNNCADIQSAWSAHESWPEESRASLTLTGTLERYLAALMPIRINRFLSIGRMQSRLPDTSEVTGVAKRLNKACRVHREQKFASEPFGVNLYGYAKGELGIGEDVRMLALAFEAADVPFCIINIELGKDVSQQDSSVDGWVTETPQYGINIFCMTGIEMCRYVCERGSQMLAGRYNIGLWPWELPEWPEAWHHAWSLVDELWGVSHYTANAYANAPVPVIPIPLPVVVNSVAQTQRSDWGLPEAAYLFVFSFDMNSRPTRKNPKGVVTAFKRAAKGKSEDEAGLVLKVSHLKPDNPEWKELETVIDSDPRIHLITAELRRPEVLSLYQNCDCYVSLHRSEGFGRSLAEAQLLGLPLIATAYSGNMEFCHPPTKLVDYTFVELNRGDYFYGDGQHWGEPDQEQAAEFMRELVGLGRTGVPPRYQTEQFSVKYCGEKFKQRLQEISQPVQTHGELFK